MRWLTLLLCAPLACFAQFSNLATTTAGDRIFFVTPLRQPGLNQFPHAKLFRLDLAASSGLDAIDAGLPLTNSSSISLSLIFQSPWTGGPVSHSAFFPSNIISTADGNYVTYTTRVGCLCCSSCLFRELASGSVVDVGSGKSVFNGQQVRVSRNGRYVLNQPTSQAPGTSRSTLLDRTTNETHFLDGSMMALSSKGDVLLFYSSSLQLTSWNGASRTIPISGVKAMDDAATTILFANSYNDLDQARLFVYDIASGQQWQLGPDDRASYGPTLSDSNRWVLYVTKMGDTPQLMLSRFDGSQRKQITDDPFGISEGVLSGDAHVAWAATRDGRLLRITTDNLQTDQVLAPPMFTDSGWTVVPGSLLRLHGYRLGTNVHIGGVASPTVGGADNEVDVQVPWDLPESPRDSGVASVILSSSRDDSPLEAASEEYSAYWYSYYPQSWMPAIHQNWMSLVSAASPAQPGEILHIYATGLGSTTCAMGTGQPAPVASFCTPVKAINWTWWWTSTDSVTADMPFVGLAPGLIGLYQMEARVPLHPPAGRLKLIADRYGNFVLADISVSQQ